MPAEPSGPDITSRLSLPRDWEDFLSLPDPGSSEKTDEEGRPEGDTRIERDGEPRIPIVLNARVHQFIRHFTGPNRKAFAKWLERSGRYQAMMQRILREEGVPEDLFYVALIESGFNPKAESWAGARGIWQFMKPTARKYGLVVNWWIDERRDPVKSTRAAARYFKDLHNTFRSWYLAQAGYNAGEGRIQWGLSRLKNKDFWTLARTRYINRETRNFVPQFVAAAIIAKSPEAYGFTSLGYEEPLRFELVPVPRPTDLQRVAVAAGVSVETIQELNPELLRWKTPPDYPDYSVKVPFGAGEKVAAALRRWEPGPRGGRYRVQKGDTLEKIARETGATVEALAALNGLPDPDQIYEGQRLVVPGARRDGGDPASGASGKASRADGKRLFHVVQSGETLWKISRRYQVSLKDLLVWNRLLEDARIQPGDKIRLFPENL